MYYKLNPNYCLRGWEKLPWAIVKRGEKNPLFISGKVFEVAKICNGHIDFDMPIILDEQRMIAKRLCDDGIVSALERASDIDESQKYLLYPARYIRTAHWSITGRCNYKCRHCSMSAPYGTLGELSFDTIMNIIEDLDKCGVRSVSLTGGEPLVRKDFWDIIRELKKRDISIIEIYSNGALINEDFIDKLFSYDCRPKINMSFDGVGYHDWLRGINGAQKSVARAFRLLSDAGISTACEMCIWKDNKHVLRESVNFLASVGCDSLKTIPISDSGQWKKNGFGESIGIGELYETYLNYIPYYYEDGAPLDIMLGGVFAAKKNDLSYYRITGNRESENPQKVCVCNHARNTLYISPEGRALPCFSLAESDNRYSFPLITDVGLPKALTDSYYMSLIETKASQVIEHNSECRDCPHRNKCMGGCRAAALFNSPDDILGRDMYSCEFYKGGWEDKLRKLLVEKQD